jgi:hypothetical protein
VSHGTIVLLCFIRVYYPLQARHVLTCNREDSPFLKKIIVSNNNDLQTRDVHSMYVTRGLSNTYAL